MIFSPWFRPQKAASEVFDAGLRLCDGLGTMKFWADIIPLAFTDPAHQKLMMEREAPMIVKDLSCEAFKIHWGAMKHCDLTDEIPKIKGVAPVVVLRKECKVREDGIYQDRGLHEDTRVDMISIPEGPEYLQYYGEKLISDYQVYLEGSRAEAEGYDAVQPDCLFDSALKPLKEALSIPVVGPLECSAHLASLLGGKFSVLVNDGSMVKFIEERAKGSGLDGKLASVRVSGVTFEELGFGTKKDVGAIREKLLAAGKKVIEEDGASVLILACTSMFGFRDIFMEEYGVPTLEPGVISAKLAEMPVELGLSQSKRAYPAPGHDILPR